MGFTKVVNVKKHSLLPNQVRLDITEILYKAVLVGPNSPTLPGKVIGWVLHKCTAECPLNAILQ